mmetsp:Transcript_166710/g.405137  ORF Transcript_166710/g.405137 Transcript_166710/m.405137 type:complete len:287 (-) Transcript_166710:6646-7506(-)
MPFISSLSRVTALQLITGMDMNISRGRDLSITWFFSSQRAPSRYMPVTYAPSRLLPSMSLACFLLTSVWMTSLSSSRFWRCAVCWHTAVRNDCGLMSPLIQVTAGMSNGLPTQPCSCSTRRWRSMSHVPRGRMLGQAIFAQPGGTRSRYRACIRPSIESDMVSSPSKPRLSSWSERWISRIRPCICSHSKKNTFWYGPRLSSMAPAISIRSNLGSPNLSRISVIAVSATRCGLWPSSASPPSLSWRSRSRRNMLSLCSVRKPISAFGCRPKASGVSPASSFSMCST